MNKITGIIIVLLVASVGLMVLHVMVFHVNDLSESDDVDKDFGISVSGNFLDWQVGRAATSTATTTCSDCVDLLVLSKNLNRRYALITNDSDTAIYLQFATSTGRPTSSPNEGIRLSANGGSYELDPPFLYTGEIRASSTASGKTLLILSK